MKVVMCVVIVVVKMHVSAATTICHIQKLTAQDTVTMTRDYTMKTIEGEFAMLIGIIEHFVLS